MVGSDHLALAVALIIEWTIVSALVEAVTLRRHNERSPQRP